MSKVKASPCFLRIHVDRLPANTKLPAHHPHTSPAFSPHHTALIPPSSFPSLQTPPSCHPCLTSTHTCPSTQKTLVLVTRYLPKGVNAALCLPQPNQTLIAQAPPHRPTRSTSSARDRNIATRAPVRRHVADRLGCGVVRRRLCPRRRLPQPRVHWGVSLVVQNPRRHTHARIVFQGHFAFGGLKLWLRFLVPPRGLPGAHPQGHTPKVPLGAMEILGAPGVPLGDVARAISQGQSTLRKAPLRYIVPLCTPGDNPYFLETHTCGQHCGN